MTGMDLRAAARQEAEVMEGRRRPLWIWTLACLLGLAALVGIMLAVWKLPSLLYRDVSKASADARLQAASASEQRSLLAWPA
jgi:hypothetical protein